MSFKEITCHVLYCDGPCGKPLELDYIVHFSEMHGGLSAADDYMQECNWLETRDGLHFCPACVRYDEETDEYVGQEKAS